MVVTVTLLISSQGAGGISSYLLRFSVFFFAIAYSDYYHLDQKSMTGIVVGVCIALTCILICILILIYRSKARYVFVLEDWAFSMQWFLGHAAFSKSAKLYEVLCLFTYSDQHWKQSTLLALPTLLLQWKEWRTHRVSGALTTKYEARFQIKKTLLSQISMLLYTICSCCLTLQPAQTWFTRL